MRGERPIGGARRRYSPGGRHALTGKSAAAESFGSGRNAHPHRTRLFFVRSRRTCGQAVRGFVAGTSVLVRVIFVEGAQEGGERGDGGIVQAYPAHFGIDRKSV